MKNRLDQLAMWWLRKRNPDGITIMRSSGEQHLLKNYDKIAEQKRS